MSRIGKQPVVIPPGVKVRLSNGTLNIEGPKGKLALTCHPNIHVEYHEAGKVIRVTRPDDERANRALHGLTRSLIANMVQGVTRGYEKRLLIEGVGYQARMDKKTIVLSVGYANAIELTPPEGVTVELTDPTNIVVRGPDKQKVGQFAAEIRQARPPEPYKGKGIRYLDEQVRRKEGKSFTSGG
jgi:large subunit ribosomal protein L6